MVFGGARFRDLSLVVTDPAVIKEIQRQGKNPDDVDFIQDYGPRVKGISSPYMKRYHNRKTGEYMAVLSRLPMVNGQGVRVDPKWRSTGPGMFISNPNQFIANVLDTAVTVRVISPQPNGTKPGDTLEWSPQFSVGGVEIAAGPVSILATDPVNSNYNNNVLSWDYGVNVKRTLRLIEGSIQERWIVQADPGAEIRIKHNAAGIGIRIGICSDANGRPVPVRVEGDEEIVDASVLASAKFPIEIGAEATYYPDPHEESASVDGVVAQNYGVPASDVAWAVIIAAAGNWSRDNLAQDSVNAIVAGTTNNEFYDLERGIFLFDSSGLPDTAVISAATLSLYGQSKVDNLSATPNVNIYSADPAGNTSLTGTDYATLGATAFCDTPITYGDWTNADYNDFVLNASGLAVINVSGITKFGTRSANYDVAEVAPNWVSLVGSYMYAYRAEKGTGYKPKLVVTYTLPTTVLAVNNSQKRGHDRLLARP